MDQNLVSKTLMDINNQITQFEANPSIPLDQKGDVRRWREDLDNITKEYQRDTERMWQNYDSKYKSKGDEIQNRIKDITTRTT